MKKIAVIIAFTMVVALSACGNAATMEDLLLASQKKDEDGIYYSALMIDLISFTQNDGKKTYTSYRLQLGIRSAEEGPIGEIYARKLGDLIGKRLNENLEYSGKYYENIHNQDYWFYCYDFDKVLGGNLDQIDRQFGFFYVKGKYKIKVPDWIDSLDSIARNAVSVVLSETNSPVKVDGDAIKYRFYLSMSGKVESENSTRVIKTLYGFEAIECVMWDKLLTDFANIEFIYKSMASGWYIIAILIGAATVAALYFISKNKKNENVLKAEPIQEIIETNSINEQIFKEETENIIEQDGEDRDAQ